MIVVASHVLNGLLLKRAELAGQIEHTQQALRQLLIDLDSLDATIRMFDPDIDLDEVKPKPLPARSPAFRGEISRIVLSTLRKAGKPLPNHEVTLIVMTARSLNAADKPLLRVLSKRVGACLRKHRDAGLVRSLVGPNRAVFWEIAG
jgi:hypothetical protein